MYRFFLSMRLHNSWLRMTYFQSSTFKVLSVPSLFMTGPLLSSQTSSRALLSRGWPPQRSRLRRRMNNELNFPPNFERLVLGCIDADFCKKILVGKLLTRSTRCAYFCTAQISKFQPRIVNICSRMNIEFPIFFHFLNRILQFFCEFFMKFCPDFATNSKKE